MNEKNNAGAQHTPGPWRLANGVQIRSDKDQIAKVWMMRNGEGVANARLIAAAPELLATLEETLEEGLGWCDDSTGCDGSTLGWVQRARAAIAKARGAQ